MSYKDDIERINTAYYREVNPAALKAELKNLGALLDGGELTKENAENAEALYCRLYIKLRLTQYFRDFDVSVCEELSDYLRTEYISAEKKGYKKTCAVMKAAENLLNRLKPVSELISETNEALNAGAELSAAVLAKIEKAKESVKGGIPSPFGGDINFIDAGALIAERLEKLTARANERRVSGLEEKVKRVVKEVSGKFLLYEYFPLPDRDATEANVQIIRTPLIDEARLYAVRATDKKLYELDAVCLESIAEDFSDDIYAYVEQKAVSLLIINSSKIFQRKRLRLYKNAMLAGKKGIKTFILDENGDGREYSECISIAVGEQSLCPSDAGASYITMPAFSDVCAEFEAKGMIRGAEEYGILKGMPFMGFLGLNRAVTSFVAGENWKYSGERASKDNEARALKYLSTLPAQHLFIDSGWGEFRAGGKPSEEDAGGYDLGEVPAGDLDAVKKIFACGYSAFAKCGMIARYFVEKAADNRGELESNVKLAVRLVFKVMRLETVPEVELREALDNPTAGGLCCGGDKLILFRYADCKNAVWLRGSIVHECFHAMQYKLRKGGWSEWYYDSFGITRGRVERWSLTNNIYDNNTGSETYKVHIIEADAYAFQADCAEQCAEAWDNLFTNFSA